MRIQAGSAGSATGVQPGGSSADSQLKAIQSQIQDTQQRLQELSANKELSKEAKDARRKELQEQLQTLNQQLMQRKAEILEERRQKVAEASRSQEAPQAKTEEEQARQESLASLQSTVDISANLQQMKFKHSVKTSLEGQAHVLGAEIKADRSRGVLSSNKVDKLSDLNSRIHKVNMDLSGGVSKINKKLKETQEADSNDDRVRTPEETEATQSDRVKREDEEATEALQESASANLDGAAASKRKDKGQYVDLLV
ncbi:FlxA-like family protein [Gorillibacterium sp. sgz500922]|uniref:FlxA-like family protein n=1 Tax=Gorillibacterium sp. sgz500922 TaxID=3446694 RepID=UPI003F666F4F